MLIAKYIAKKIIQNSQMRAWNKKKKKKKKVTENCLFVKKAPLQRQDFQPVKPANM